MSPFWSGILNLFTGGLSGIFTHAANGDGWSNLGNILSNWGNTAQDLGNQNMLGNLVAKFTGSRLTDAEQQANAFTAQREDLAWQRQLDAANTQYQRQVEDMKAAGLNPMLAAGGSGAVVPSASSSGSVSPSGASLNLGSLLSVLLESKLLPAKLANLEADTAKKSAEASETSQQVDFFDRVKDLRAEGERLSNDMKRSEMRSIEQSIDESKIRVGRELANTKESEARAQLAVAEALLSAANADNIISMRPFIQAELTARTAAERQQAKTAAVAEAYQQGLIDNGAIYAAIREQNANASRLEIEAKMKDFEQSIRDGSLQKAAERLGDWRSSIVAGLYSGLNGVVKSALGKW